ncbi:dihydroorotase family protein [Candidatus Bathyarchaeota archaeon]|nr:dihydroorotase family protein [Candidatus Bathyarchaeota archaeon]
MTADLRIKNARIYTEIGIFEGGITIKDGTIQKIGKEGSLEPAVKDLDAKGLLVLPGPIDAHVHLRDQELSYKEEFASGTAAAACGGITTVLDMPNNDPLTATQEALRKRMEAASGRIFVNVGFYSAFPKVSDRSKAFKIVRAIVEEGALAFKLFLSQQVGGIPIDDDNELMLAFEAAENAGVPVAIHAEDRRELMKAQDVARSFGAFSPRLQRILKKAEISAIERVIRLASKTTARIHICHVSTEGGLQRILSAKKEGLKLTCEVTPHHMLLSTTMARRLGSLSKVSPPLRPYRDVKFLRNAVGEGLVDIIASDHAPHALSEKLCESMEDAKPGFPGLEILLPILLTEVAKGRLTITRFVELTSKRPASIFNLDLQPHNLGSLENGRPANLVIVDLKREERIDPSRFKSKAHYSPFQGHRTIGKPIVTIVNGTIVMENGEIVSSPGIGKILRKQR